MILINGNGWIKIHRSLLNWEWYRDTNTKTVFLHLLLLANIGTSKYKGFTLQKGQMIVTYPELSETLGLTVQNIRTAINHLKSTGEITVKTTNKFSLVTVINWELYQSQSDEQADKSTDKLTVNQQTTNRQVTRVIKENKNIRTKEYNSLSDKPTGKKFIPPTIDEVSAYCRERKNNVDAETFIDFYTSKGWIIGKKKMKDWKSAVQTWERSRRDTQNKPQPYQRETINEYNNRLLNKFFGGDEPLDRPRLEAVIEHDID